MSGEGEEGMGEVVYSFATAGAGGRGRVHVTRLGGGFVLHVEDVPAEFVDGDEEFAEVEVFLSEKAGAALASWLRRNVKAYR